jgi:tetraacyldisaccharide 4'-kinase
LREPISGKNRASAVIVTKCPQYIAPIDYNIIIKKLALYPYQQFYFSIFEYGNLTPVFPDIQTAGKRELGSLAEDEDVLLITGIASPARVIEELKKYTSRIDILSFADHHDFNKEDIALIEQRFNNLKGEKGIIITTEKDAARLASHPKITDEIKKWMYALPIEVKFLRDQQETFNKHIMDYVRKNKRDSIFSERKDRLETEDGYYIRHGTWQFSR